MQNDAITLEAIRKEKAILEDRISQALEDFRKETGDRVHRIVNVETAAHGIIGMACQVELC